MDNNPLMFTEQVRKSLERLKLSGEVFDDGQVIHVTLSDGRGFEISHQFMGLVTTRRNIDTNIAYKLGLKLESPREG